MPTKAPTDAQTIAKAETVLRHLLPPSWDTEVNRPSNPGPDFIMTMTAPDGERAVFVIKVKREATGPQLQNAVEQLRNYAMRVPGSQPVFVAPWIGEQSRERLAADGISYIDTTGNTRLVSDRPGLMVTATGETKNPWPLNKALQSLRGPGTARAVRALTDFAPPYGVRELAGRTTTSPATLSRVIGLLKEEALLETNGRGKVVNVDWAGALRRWAQDYDVLRTNEAVGYLQPRGLAALTSLLGPSGLRYAVTGSLAANLLAPVAPARLGMIYVEDLHDAVTALDLRETEAGANVTLLVPFDDIVFARTITREGLTLVHPTQLTVDLLTGPGRAPSEGEALLAWMKDNIDAWRH